MTTTIRVDDQISYVNSESNTSVGDLIDQLMSSLPPNRILTRVSLDGHNYGEMNSQVFGQSLEQVKDLQIRTADKAIWSATGLDIALSCLEGVQRSLIRAAELFREVDKAKANQFFVHCIDGLERFLEAITITRCALNLDFVKITVDGRSLAQIEQSLLQVLKNILELQEKQDFTAIADKVEYELITNLHSWTTSLRLLRNSNRSNA